MEVSKVPLEKRVERFGEKGYWGFGDWGRFEIWEGREVVNV